MILTSHIFPPPVPSRNVGHPCRRLRHPSRSRSPELRELACRGNALPLLPDEAPALHTCDQVTSSSPRPHTDGNQRCWPAAQPARRRARPPSHDLYKPASLAVPPLVLPGVGSRSRHGFRRRLPLAVFRASNAPPVVPPRRRPRRAEAGRHRHDERTSTVQDHGPPRQPVAAHDDAVNQDAQAPPLAALASRTVSTMTPAQLARKRMQDREAQRAIRSRTRDHIERLEKEIRELRVVMAAKPGASNEDTVRELCRRNGVLEEELARLREYLSAGKLAPAYAPSDLAVAHAMAATAPFDAACTFPTALDASPVYEYDARAGTGFYPEPPTAPPPPPSARSSLGQCAPAAPRYGFHVGEAGPWSAPAFGPAMAVPDQPFQPPPANDGSSNMTAAAPTPLSTPRPTHTCTCAAASPACRDGDGYASTQFGALEDAKAWVAAPTPFGQPKHHAA
ncbi:hypothetical protein DCS_04122 [Drechmeria coniospora]|uniref:BZIP transcription factor n=1 Tax=Drechmeria coniospora TaxID=98403 RepID=A0A151GJ24_DRECN|nr:hypothetical protein DCS_04122 [Drechmeria coniospora]KYK57115.1 hypothetical protein DCS_04122 [Drechmeria coniospora]